MLNNASCAPVTDYANYANRLIYIGESGSFVSDTYNTCASCEVQACADGTPIAEGCSDFGCYNTRVDGIESPEDCQAYAAEAGVPYPGTYCDAEMHCLDPGCYCDEYSGSCEWQGATGSAGCVDIQPPASYRDCSMYADECGPDGVCMSAMDSPGICGFSCQADSDCDQVGGGVCDATEGVCVDPDGYWLGELHECRPVADGPAECDSGYSCRMARFCMGDGGGSVQCSGDELYCTDADGNGFCHQGNACPDAHTSPANCNDGADACGAMEICEPVYSECRIACDAATPCPQGLECLEEGFCFDLSGSSAAIACNADGACDDAAYTCFVESQCLMQCVDDSDCGADEFCNDESFVCEWNGGGSGWDCAANEVQCEEPDGTISCHPEGHDCGGETVGTNCDAANPVACEEADGSVTCHPEGHIVAVRPRDKLRCCQSGSV